MFIALTLSAALAHPNLQNSLSVAFETSRVRVDVNVSVKELSVAHGIEGLPINGVGRLDTGAIKRAADDHRDYVLRHLKLTTGARVLEGKMIGLISPPFFADPIQTFYQYQIEYPFVGPPAVEISFFQDMLKEWPYSAGTSWNVSYVVRTKQTDGTEASPWLLPCQQAVSIPTGWENPVSTVSVVSSSGGWRSFNEYLWHGIKHILTGYDHLLFIVALVIGTVSFWEMVKVIAAFTIAHSLTLALCVFGLVRLPTYLVEPIIALSIIYVSLENALRPKRAHSRIRLAVAFGFGLIHGLGFAGGLLDAMTGLPALGIWIALVAFSLGVEIGHQLVVLPLFALLSLSRQKINVSRVDCLRRYGSVLVACAGAYYLIVALKQQFL